MVQPPRAAILNDRRGDVLLVASRGWGCLTTDQKNAFFPWEIKGGGVDELPFSENSGIRWGNHVAGEDDIMVAPARDLHHAEFRLVPVNSIPRGEVASYMPRGRPIGAASSSRYRSAPTS